MSSFLLFIFSSFSQLVVPLPSLSQLFITKVNVLRSRCLSLLRNLSSLPRVPTRYFFFFFSFWQLHYDNFISYTTGCRTMLPKNIVTYVHRITSTIVILSSAVFNDKFICCRYHRNIDMIILRNNFECSFYSSIVKYKVWRYK